MNTIYCPFTDISYTYMTLMKWHFLKVLCGFHFILLFCLAHIIIQVVLVCTANLNLWCAFLQLISTWSGQPFLNVWLWATGVVFLFCFFNREELFRICCTGEMERAMKKREKSTHSFFVFISSTCTGIKFPALNY